MTRKKSKPAGVPLRQLIAYGLLVRQAGRGTPANRLANAFVEIFQRDRSVKDPVAAAHKMLSRAERRALGERRYEYGRGSLAPSIKTRNAR